jgi:hypothetical protein
VSRGEEMVEAAFYCEDWMKEAKLGSESDGKVLN